MLRMSFGHSECVTGELSVDDRLLCAFQRMFPESWNRELSKAIQGENGSRVRVAVLII